jgi:hypothetical protein
VPTLFKYLAVRSTKDEMKRLRRREPVWDYRMGVRMKVARETGRGAEKRCQKTLDSAHISLKCLGVFSAAHPIGTPLGIIRL